MKNMNKKGQGAMEYLMTYGWAILVVLIVGIVLWQLGIFSGLGGGAGTSTGFASGKVGIIDAGTKCTPTGMQLMLTNQAGSPLSNVVLNGTGAGYCAGGGTASTNLTAAGDRVSVTVNCTDNQGTVKEKTSVPLTVKFTEKVAGTEINRTQTGVITCTVEPEL